MDRLRKAVDEFMGKVKLAIQGEPKSPAQILLDEHLCLFDDMPTFSPKNTPSNVAIPTFVLNDLAARTKNVVDYPMIMHRIWAVMEESEQDPAVMRKVEGIADCSCLNSHVGYGRHSICSTICSSMDRSRCSRTVSV